MSERGLARTVVIGIGNTLLGDDGAGVHVIERLARTRLPEHVELIDGGTLSFTLLEAVESADYLIVIDAADLDRPAGAIEEYHDAQMEQFLSARRRSSVHEVHLLDLLSAARFRDQYPQRLSLIAIQPGKIGWDSLPTDPVAEAIERASDRVLELSGLVQ